MGNTQKDKNYAFKIPGHKCRLICSVRNTFVGIPALCPGILLEVTMAHWYCVSDFTFSAPPKPGCYAIYWFDLITGEKKLIYIGTAQNLSQRLAKHEVKRVLFALLDLPKAVYIKCREVEDERERLKLEKKLIKKLQPKANL
jgi:predicted GIY-YIG superfamily endonuclease